MRLVFSAVVVVIAGCSSSNGGSGSSGGAPNVGGATASGGGNSGGFGASAPSGGTGGTGGASGGAGGVSTGGAPGSGGSAGAIRDAGADSSIDSSSPPPDGGDRDDGAIDAGTNGPLLTLGDGVLAGKIVGKTDEFLAIPYAAPPIGSLRFAPPEPPLPWTGVRNATKVGKYCPQPAGGGVDGGQLETSEDCLFLNVYAPSKTPAKPAPVMVFVHGGSFVIGGGGTMDGRPLSEAGGVVVVTLNYRLGALGFLVDPSIDQAIGVPSGNLGIRDQQAAFEWVKKNIAEFGGDPKNVTFFGESAGAVSGCIQMFTTGSEDLIQRFILESGGCIENPGVPMQRPQVARPSAALVKALCPGGEDTLACLRRLDVKTFVDATSYTGSVADAGSSTPQDYLGEGFRPQVDGVLIKDTPVNLIAKGTYNHAPVITGTNAHEALLLESSASGINSALAFTLYLVATYPNEWTSLLPLYAPATDADALDSFVRLTTDTWFRCPTRYFARAIADKGGSVYLYSFDVPPAAHTEELDYVFGLPIFGPEFTTPAYPASAPVPPLPGLVASVQSYWTTFALSGDPNTQGRFTWPKYATASDQNLVLDQTPSIGTALAKNACDVWDQTYKQVIETP